MEQVNNGNDTPFSNTEKYLLYRIQQLESERKSFITQIENYVNLHLEIDDIEKLLLDYKNKLTSSVLHLKKLQQMEESCTCEISCALRFGTKSITDTTVKELQYVIDDIDRYFNVSQMPEECENKFDAEEHAKMTTATASDYLYLNDVITDLQGNASYDGDNIDGHD